MSALLNDSSDWLDRRLESHRYAEHSSPGPPTCVTQRGRRYGYNSRSPGARGIVLIHLYLAVDQSDHRPLIIDQTHNANLVVITVADQVIVASASASAHVPGGLSSLSNFSGGLESPAVRHEVYEILECGKPAFEERA